jgi:hypothetical protein
MTLLIQVHQRALGKASRQSYQASEEEQQESISTTTTTSNEPVENLLRYMKKKPEQYKNILNIVNCEIQLPATTNKQRNTLPIDMLEDMILHRGAPYNSRITRRRSRTV